jgi:hypothetical protein
MKTLAELERDFLAQKAEKLSLQPTLHRSPAGELKAKS